MIKNWPDSQAVLWLGSLELGTELALQFVRSRFCFRSEISKSEISESLISKNKFLLDANTHPDFKMVKPEGEETESKSNRNKPKSISTNSDTGEGTGEDTGKSTNTTSTSKKETSKSMGFSKPIKIDQIRALQEWIMAKPLIASEKIAIILPGEALNIQAANAFLKTLEEPPPYARFILICQKIGNLPLTIRSRCQILREELLDKAYIQALGLELKQSSFRDETLKSKILKDLADIKNSKRDPIELGAEWAKGEGNELLYWLLVILSESLSKAVQAGRRLPGLKWWEWCDQILQAKRALDDRFNLNKQLLMESILIKYLDLAVSRGF